MEEFYAVGATVWASAKSDIFWPAQVVEAQAEDQVKMKGLVAVVNFLVEDTFENIRSQKKIFPWNCRNQEKFIEKGRALKSVERQLEFNRALAEADRQVMSTKHGQRRQTKRKGSNEDFNLLRDSSTSCSNIEKHIPNGDSAHEDVRSRTSEMKEEEKAPQRTSPRKKQKSSHAATCVEANRENLNAKCCREDKSPVGNVPEENRLTCSLKISKSCNEKPATKTLKRNIPEEQEEQNKKQKKRNSYSRKRLSVIEKPQANVDNLSLTSGQNLGLQQGESSNISSETVTQNTCRELAFGSRSSAKCDSAKNEESKREDSSQITRLHEEAATPEKLNIKRNKSAQRRPTRSSPAEKNAVSGCAHPLYNGNGFSERTLLLNEQESIEKVSLNGADDADESSDDELLVPFSPSKEISEFAVGDIVWAKYFCEPYWPAQIKRVTGKRKSDRKFAVVFLGYNEGLFQIQPKKLVHYACEPTQREQFLSIQEQIKHDAVLHGQFLEAMSKAEDLMNRKGLGKNEEDESEDESFEVLDEEGGDDGDDEVADSTPPVNPTLVEHRKSARVKKQVSKYKDIISYIRQAKPTLKQIFEGKKPCERHQIFKSGRVHEKGNLKRQAGFGPVGDGQQQDQMMQLLLDFYKEVRGDSEVLDVRYVSDVWLPEAIIWSMQQIDHVDRATAEQMYFEGSEYAVTTSEVQELTCKLKRRTLSEEEKEARLEKAKRALERR